MLNFFATLFGGP